MVWKTCSAVLLLAALCAAIPVRALNDPPSKANATLFGPNVFVFDPKMPAADIEKTANDIFAKMEKNQFGSERYARRASTTSPSTWASTPMWPAWGETPMTYTSTAASPSTPSGIPRVTP